MKVITSIDFVKYVDLRVGRIVSIEEHPNAEKLFIEKIDCGEEEPRVVISGLREYYSVDQLLHQNVIVVANLNPIKLRGIESSGMILTVIAPDLEEHETAGSLRSIEVLHPMGEAGSRIWIQGTEDTALEYGQLTIKDFFAVPIEVKNSMIYLSNTDGSHPVAYCFYTREGEIKNLIVSKTIREGLVS